MAGNSKREIISGQAIMIKFELCIRDLHLVSAHRDPEQRVCASLINTASVHH